MLQIRTKSHQSNSFNIYIAHYLQGLWKKLFCASSSDHGTLNQMYSLLGRLAAAKNPKSDMNACVDALMTVLNGHYIAIKLIQLSPSVCHQLKWGQFSSHLPSLINSSGVAL